MESNLKKWQRSMIRNGIVRYRENLQNYYIKEKPIIEVDQGKAFSLLSPSLGSAAARRRIRFIMKDIVFKDTGVGENGAIAWASRTPHFMTIAVTYKCQCDCLHCSVYVYREEVKRQRNGLSINELKRAVNEAVDLGTTCVIFTGGEPLLCDHIYDLVRTVDKHRSICTIFTNGEYLNEDSVLKLKEAGIFGLFVSLDYSDPEKHDENRRRKGLFEKAVQGIRLCQERGILTGISTYITKEKILCGELDEMMDLAKRLNVLEVFVFDIIATGRLKDEPSCMLNENEVNGIKEFRRRYNEKPDYPRIIHQTMFTSIAYPCAAEGCPGGVAQMHLRANGDISPCDFTPLSFGNIRQRSMRKIWESMRQSDIYSKPLRGCRLADPDFRNQLMERSTSA